MINADMYDHFPVSRSTAVCARPMHASIPQSERREADRRTYEGFLHPHRLCRNNALEDGRSSWRAALRLARKRKYAAARSRLVDARRCFQWAGRAEKEIKELERIEEELEVPHWFALV